MSAEHHHRHDHDREFDPVFLAHFARHLTVPALAAAATMSALHDQGMAYAIGAVVAWLSALLYTSMAAMHDWKACPRCPEPPHSLATPGARARLARSHHRRWLSKLNKLAVMAVIAHAVLPKPYMGPWWTKAIAGAVYFLVGGWTSYDMVRASMHRRYHEECHLEWCRAGLKHRPGETWTVRRHRWLAHHGVWLIAVLALSACALGLYTTQHPSIWLRASYGIVVFATGWSALNMSVVHTTEPCVRCARNLPDKPEEAAEQRHPWLRLFHRSRVALIAGSIGAWVASWMAAGTIAAKVLVCVAALALVCWAVLDRLHSPVKPWCPWCKDDGGEDAGADVPDPASSVPSPV